MTVDCPMTEECPGYDRDRQACLIHPGDCEFSREDGSMNRGSKEKPDPLTPERRVQNDAQIGNWVRD